MAKQLNLFFPQWQGSGPDLSVYHGALELKQFFKDKLNFTEVAVSTNPVTATEDNIYGYSNIIHQMKEARSIIDHTAPGSIFTLGGGCDAGILPLSYLNKLCRGDLAVVWFDAHGDLNSPQTSPSKFFYGMPVRTLLGDNNSSILNLCYKNLNRQQLALCGLRELDPAEQEYIEKEDLKVITVSAMANNPARPAEILAGSRFKNLYIHLDLDVIDPEEFPNSPVPEPNGLSTKTLKEALAILVKSYNLVGFGLFEYSPSGKKPATFLEEVINIGSRLNSPTNI